MLSNVCNRTDGREMMPLWRTARYVDVDIFQVEKSARQVDATTYYYEIGCTALVASKTYAEMNSLETVLQQVAKHHERWKRQCLHHLIA